MAPRFNIAIKALLVVLIATSLVFGDAERFSDKAMGARAVAYPLMCALPALAWWIGRRRRPGLTYPHLADALVTTAFVVDLGGNALDLFDELTWFDDAAHFTNWFILGLALGVTLRRTRPPWEVVWMVTGAGAVAAILWELAEYQSFVQKVEQLGLYRDTIGDLCLGTSGALIAGLLVIGARRASAVRSEAH
ncbi:MAG: hypothetical protein JWN99_3307 [Ilumatobacteraceae bacterium]|nr:hypothetical protein [Ilumatobacteraceae bacterium]